MDSVGGGSSINFPGSVFSGGEGSSINVPGSIFSGGGGGGNSRNCSVNCSNIP